MAKWRLRNLQFYVYGFLRMYHYEWKPLQSPCIVVGKYIYMFLLNTLDGTLLNVTNFVRNISRMLKLEIKVNGDIT